MVLKVPLLILLLVVDYVFGSCGVCQTNYIACHSETTFSLCLDGIPTDEIIACPVGRVCTNQTTICLPEIDDSVKANCVNENVVTYTDDLSESTVGTSNQDLIDTDTTTRTARDGTTFCTEIAERGTFRAEGDTTCTKYYLCVTSGNYYRGFEYRCIIPNYYNSETRQCQVERPGDCPEDGSSSTSPIVAGTDPPGSGSSSITQDSTSTDPITIQTTTRAPRDATTFCSETGQSGAFKAEGDTTCTKYYICMFSYCGYRGFEYTCYNSNYFNSETNLCQRDRPDNC